MAAAIPASVVLTGALPAYAGSQEWSCDGNAYLFATSGTAGDAAHTVTRIDLATGTASDLGHTPEPMDAADINPTDFLVYGWDSDAGAVVRLTAELAPQDLGAPAGIPHNTPAATARWDIGAFDGQGHLWLADTSGPELVWLEADYASGSTTYAHALRWGTAQLPDGLAVPGDWALVGEDLLMVAVAADGARPAHLLRFSTQDAALSDAGTLEDLTSASGYGAAYADAAQLYVSRNSDGALVRIDPATRTATEAAAGPSFVRGDGARCTAALPTLTLDMQVPTRTQATDQWQVSATPAGQGAALATAVSGTPIPDGGPAPVPVPASPVTLTVEPAAGASPQPQQYATAVTCTDTADDSAVDLEGSAPAWTLSPQVGHSYACTGTATATLPATVALTASVDPADADSYTEGTAVTVHLAVRNTGSGALTELSIAGLGLTGVEPAPEVTCPVSELAPGETAVCTASHTLTGADVDAGQISVSATATGKDPRGRVLTSNLALAVFPAGLTPALSVAVAPAPMQVTAARQAVTTPVTVGNSGNAPVTGIAVSPAATGGTGTWGEVSCPADALVPGQVMQCMATYTVGQGDLDAAAQAQGATTALAISATAHGQHGGAPAEGASAPVDIQVAAAAAVSINARPLSALTTRPGQVVHYVAYVRNTGSVTTGDVAVTAATFGGGGTAPALSCRLGTETVSADSAGARSLAPGQDLACTGQYTVTQADIDTGGEIPLVFAAHGRAGTASAAAQGDATTLVRAQASLDLAASATTDSATWAAGTVVTYSALVANSGARTLHAISLVPQSFGGSGTAPAWTCDDAALAPGQTTHCTATYTLTRADARAGSIAAQVRAVGNEPEPPAAGAVADPVLSDTVAANAPGAASTGLAADVLTFGGTAGTPLGVSIRVTNTGQVGVGDLGVTLSGIPAVGDEAQPWCPSGIVAPGASVTCTTWFTPSSQAPPRQVTAQAHATAPSGAGVEAAPASARWVDQGADGAANLEVPDAATSSGAAALAASANMTVSPPPDGSGGAVAPGAVIHVSVQVANRGTSEVQEVAVRLLHLTAAESVGPLTCPSAGLAAGDTVQCQGDYTVTQQDIDAGQVSVRAVATAVTAAEAQRAAADHRDPDRAQSLPVAVGVASTIHPGLDAELSVTPPEGEEGAITAGTELDVEVAVHNRGDVSLADLTVSPGPDTQAERLAALSCPAGLVAPGASTTCAGTYTVGQSDVDAGKVTVGAQVTGTVSSRGITTQARATSMVDIPHAPQLTLEATITPADAAALVPGAAATVTLRVTNTGNVSVFALAVRTDRPGPAPTCQSAVLAPGQATECTRAVMITASDVLAGGLTLATTATGRGPDGSETASQTLPVRIDTTPVARLDLKATLDMDRVAQGSTADTRVTATFTVSNTGTAVVDRLAVAMTRAADTGLPSDLVPTCPQAPLSPGQTATCQATWAVPHGQQQVSLTARASARSAAGEAVESPDAAASSQAPAAAALAVQVSARLASTGTTGTLVSYSAAVTNTGDVAVTALTTPVTDFTGAGEAPTLTCPLAVLAPGEQTQCTGSYVLTQRDIDAALPADGRASAVPIVATLTATGRAPDGRLVAAGTSSAAVQPAHRTSLALAASVSPNGTIAFVRGVTLTYAFAVTNTGTTLVRGLTVVPQSFTGHGAPGEASCPSGALLPGRTARCTLAYALTADDIKAGSVDLRAGVTATGPDGAALATPVAHLGIPAASGPHLEAAVWALPPSGDGQDMEAPAQRQAGDPLDIAVTVTNAGDAPILDLTASVTQFSGTGTTPTLACPRPDLEVGASATCVATYSLSAQDVEAGSLTLEATAHGAAPPDGRGHQAQGTSDPASTTIPLGTQTAPAPPAQGAPTPQDLTVWAAVRPTGPGYFATGRAVQFVARVLGAAGQAPAAASILTESLTGTGAAPAWSCADTPAAATGDIWCQAPYTLTQADIDNGGVSLTLRATDTAGQATAGQPHAGQLSPASTAAIVGTGRAEISAALLGGRPATTLQAGSELTYDVAITNTGTVTVRDLQAALSGMADPAPAFTCPTGALAPGDSATCTATSTVTAQDQLASSVPAQLDVSATTPRGNTATASTDATVTAGPRPALTLAKSVTGAGGELAEGTELTYRFVVTNTGNVPITALTIDDSDFSGAGPLGKPACPQQELAAGAQTICTATYTVTQADVDAGRVINSATVLGIGPDGKQVRSPASSAGAPGPQRGSLELAATAGPASSLPDGVPAGALALNFQVVNTSSTAVDHVAVTPRGAVAGTLAPLSCPSGHLEAGQQQTCASWYVPASQERNAGTAQLVFRASGITTGGEAVGSPTSALAVPVENSAALELTATAAPASVSEPGAVARFDFAARNTGSVTLTDLVVDLEPWTGVGQPSDVTCPPGPLEPGQVATCTITTTMTASDINAGGITATGSATATAPDGRQVTCGERSATVAAAPAPALQVTLSQGDDASSSYRAVVANTGDLGVTGLRVTVGGEQAACPATSVAAGRSVTCTVTLSDPPADLSAQADAFGSPGGVAVTARSQGIRAAGVAALSAAAMLDPADSLALAAGQPLTAQVTLTNTGGTAVRALRVATLQWSGAGALAALTCPATTLEPGAATVCSAQVTLSQADIDAAQVLLAVQASGLDPSGGPVAAPVARAAIEPVRVPALAASAWTPAAGESLRAGDTATVWVVVRNGGNVTLTDPAVEWDAAGSAQAVHATCPAGPLAPGAFVTCSVQAPLSQDQAGAAGVHGVARATAGMGAHVISADPQAVAAQAAGTSATSATAPAPSLTAGPTTAPAAASTAAAATASATPGAPDLDPLRLVVTMALGPGGSFQAGEAVTVRYEVTNTGPQAVRGVAISTVAFTGGGAAPVPACGDSPTPGLPGVLLPGASWECAGTYTLTGADATAGTLTLSAIAAARTAGEQVAVGSPQASSRLDRAEHTTALTVSAAGQPVDTSGDRVVSQGDEVRWHVTVVNQGDVAVRALHVISPAGAATCPQLTLGAGEEMTCELASSTVTAGDATAGSAATTVAVTALAPDGAAIRPGAVQGRAVVAQEGAAAGSPPSPGLATWLMLTVVVLAGGGAVLWARARGYNVGEFLRGSRRTHQG